MVGRLLFAARSFIPFGCLMGKTFPGSARFPVPSTVPKLYTLLLLQKGTVFIPRRLRLRSPSCAIRSARRRCLPKRPIGGAS